MSSCCYRECPKCDNCGDEMTGGRRTYFEFYGADCCDTTVYKACSPSCKSELLLKQLRYKKIKDDHVNQAFEIIRSGSELWDEDYNP